QTNRGDFRRDQERRAAAQSATSRAGAGRMDVHDGRGGVQPGSHANAAGGSRLKTASARQGEAEMSSGPPRKEANGRANFQTEREKRKSRRLFPHPVTHGGSVH